jgi:hypothetical protein
MEKIKKGRASCAGAAFAWGLTLFILLAYQSLQVDRLND